jgi:RNA polymerase sigma-70 factor (ECF subfamily)
MEPWSEQETAGALRRGDRAGWLRLYDHYAERLWQTVARQMRGERDAVADVVQETFMAAARAARQFDPARGTLWLWLWGIARNQMALHFRRRAGEQRAAAAAAAGCNLREWIQGRDPMPHDVLEAGEAAHAVRVALARLSDEHAFVLIAVHLEDLPAPQVAEMLGRSPQAVRSMAVRAREAFRAVFLENANELPNQRLGAEKSHDATRV